MQRAARGYQGARALYDNKSIYKYLLLFIQGARASRGACQEDYQATLGLSAVPHHTPYPSYAMPAPLMALPPYTLPSPCGVVHTISTVLWPPMWPPMWPLPVGSCTRSRQYLLLPVCLTGIFPMCTVSPGTGLLALTPSQYVHSIPWYWSLLWHALHSHTRGGVLTQALEIT